MEDLAELLERRKAQYQGDQGVNKSDMVAPSSKLLVSPQSSSTFNKQQQQQQHGGGGSPTSRSQQHQHQQQQQQLQQKQQQEVVAQHPQPRGGGGGGGEEESQEDDDDYDDDDHQQQKQQQPPKEEKEESGRGQEKESGSEFPEEEGEHTGISPTSSLRKQGFPGGGGPSLLSPSARTIGTQSPSGASHKKLIDTFLRGVREIGRHRCPSERELEITRDYLNWLAFKTREDHVRSVDEIVTQIPTQFNEEIRKLQQAEDLVYAAAAGRLEKVKKNLEENWELTQAVDRDGRTALHSAAAVDQQEVIEMLLEKGLKVDTQDYEGYTALHWAVENNAAHAVGSLLRHEADILLRTNDGYTVLDLQNDPTETKEAEIISEYLDKAKQDHPGFSRKPEGNGGV